MNNGRVNWQGNFVALVTPFTKDGDIDERLFRENIELVITEGAEGIIPSGSSGEPWSMTYEERVRLFELAKDQSKGRVPVIAGTADSWTKNVVELSRRAKEVGCDGVMVRTPHYCVTHHREVVEHYQVLSDEVDIPILLYNIPQETFTSLEGDLLKEVADIKNVVGIKQSTDDFIEVQRTIRDYGGGKLSILCGLTCYRGVPGLYMGADGLVSSSESQIMGEEAIEFYHLVKEGKREEAISLQFRAIKLHDEISAVGSSMANVKEAMNLRGRPGGYPRRPILPLTPEESEKVKATLESLDLL